MFDFQNCLGQYEEVLEAIKWSTDYFIKCHVSPYEFYGQVGSTESDTEFWGRPEDMNMSRPAYKITKKQPGNKKVTYKQMYSFVGVS